MVVLRINDLPWVITVSVRIHRTLVNIKTLRDIHSYHPLQTPCDLEWLVCDGVQAVCRMAASPPGAERNRCISLSLGMCLNYLFLLTVSKAQTHCESIPLDPPHVFSPLVKEVSSPHKIAHSEGNPSCLAPSSPTQRTAWKICHIHKHW